MLSKLDPKFTYKVWGGQKLSKIKNHICELLPLGETWEISTHNDGPSLIAGQNLNELCELSYLVKFIDTSDNLSVQVHPGDDYAKVHENSLGKTECWMILDCEVGCGIYLGFKSGVTKKEFKTAIANGLDVEKYLNYIEVKKGDYFYVPFGLVHAIGSGVTLCEVQQSSGITYRVWDWNRVDADGVSRELHIDKALDVLNFKDDFNNSLLKSRNVFEKDEYQKIIEHNDFKADLLTVRCEQKIEVRLTEKEGVSIIEGEAEIDGVRYSKFESGIMLKPGMINIIGIEKTRILVVRE
jgi:mannose-6-phosphate isomerase